MNKSQTIEEVSKSYFHGFSDKQWEELKDQFPYSVIESIAKEYAKQKCKEQRKICRTEYAMVKSHDDYLLHCGAILNAPEPDFD